MTRRCLTHPIGFNADIELIGCPAHFYVRAFILNASRDYYAVC